MNFFNTLLKGILDFVIPPLCPICKKPIQTIHCLCPTCFEKIQFISYPYCVKCGRPFEFDIPEETRCGACSKKNPVFYKARAVFIYDSFSKQLILPFKHADHLELTPILTNLLYQGGKDLFEETDVLLGVPLHRLRFIKRKYNQAGVLAQSLAKKIHKPYLPNVLIRARPTPSQGHMRPAERKRNVTGAFKVIHPELIKGKRILIVDDVFTTGATVNECSKILLKNGAACVSVLTLARVIKT